MALANRCCGIVRALQTAAEAQGAIVQNFIWPKSIETDIARLAGTIKELWPERFSTSNLQKRIGKLVLELAAKPISQETQRRFMASLADLNCFAERKLCIAPVEGITLVSDDPVVFGPFVLRRATQLELDKIHALTAEMLSRTLHTPEEQVGLAAVLRKNAEEWLAGSVILEFEAIADAEQAHAVFIEKANMLMDLLQMSTQIADFCGSARVGLRGHSHAGSYSAWVLPLNPGDWCQLNERTGALGDLCLNSGNLFLMRRAGVMRLAAAIGRKATPLEGALLRAVHWFAQATLQEHGGQNTLALVVCLEAVLSLSSGRAMAESVALLVGVTPRQRRHIYSLVQDAYAVRNLVVHEGNVAQAFSRQEEFRRVVREFITTGINLCDELTTPQCLIRRVGELRFS
jgi:hypothetical protein